MLSYFQQARPNGAQAFNLDVVWKVFRQLGSSLLTRIPAPSSVNFNIYFWTVSRQADVLALIDGVSTGIKTALDHAKIDIPYPQIVVHRCKH